MLVPAHLLSLGALIDIGLHSRVDSNLSILFSGGGSVFAEEYLSPSICRALQRQLISACLCGSLTTQQFLCRGEATRWGARRSSAKWRVGSQPSAGFFSIQKVRYAWRRQAEVARTRSPETLLAGIVGISSLSNTRQEHVTMPR